MYDDFTVSRLAAGSAVRFFETKTFVKSQRGLQI